MPHTAKILKDLQALELLSQLPETMLAHLARFSKHRKVRAGETIFCQGEPSPYCFGVLSGEIIIQRVSRDRRFLPKVLGVLGPGEIFGESSLFKNSPRAAMATASKDGEVLAIQAEPLRAWLKSEPQAGSSLLMGMLDTALTRLRQTSHELTVIYGVGRLLGSGSSFKEQLPAVMQFLKGSLEGVDDILFYRKSPFWDEFDWIAGLPVATPLPPLPKDCGLVRDLASSREVFTLDPSNVSAALSDAKIPWAGYKSMVMIPMLDFDLPRSPLQAIMFLGSRKGFPLQAAGLTLLLSSLATPLAEALSRDQRQEDSLALKRLDQARQSYRHP